MEQPDKDETFSWRLATAIMVIATIFTVASRVLNFDPFTDVFDYFIVYLPTAVLVGTMLLRRGRSLNEASGFTGDRGSHGSTAA